MDVGVDPLQTTFRTLTGQALVGSRMYSLIFEMRHDSAGEYYHLVTLWKSTHQERKLYEEHS